MNGNNVLFFAIAGITMLLSVVLKKLTAPGALTGGLLAVCVYVGAGFTGIALLGSFLILGTAATSFKRGWKERNGISKTSESRRTAGQVLANGGVAAILGIAALLHPQYALLLQGMMAASLASATADTLSSELGVVYGRRFYNIRTLQPDARGRDGAVSWEGTAIGVAGSVVIALVYATGSGLPEHLPWIILAGTIGNLADSFLGATLERSRLLSNNGVNFCNTLIAALAALLFNALL